MHPYKSKPDIAFWARSVSEGFDAGAVVHGDNLLRKGDRVISAGSCFASNLVPYLESSGYEYLRTELRPQFFRHLPSDTFGYDKFSAAYGNIYTVRQLLQLVRRTRGSFRPIEDRWFEGQSIKDPYRPGLRFPARSNEEFDRLTSQHLRATKKAFETASVLILTLGLTEAWVSKQDGAVFPACPGTIAGRFDADLHAYINFSHAEISADLAQCVDELRELNGDLRIIVTVSPVPLVATAGAKHVLSASTYSKAVLRVVAEDVSKLPNVTYFPSFEIVTGPQAPEDFFSPDRRSVSPMAIDLVMKAFLSKCDGGDAARSSAKIKSPAPSEESLASKVSRLITVAECEEEMAG